MKLENLSMSQLLKRKVKLNKQLGELIAEVDSLGDRVDIVIEKQERETKEKEINANLSKYEKYVKGKPQTLALKKAKHKYYLKIKAAKLTPAMEIADIVETEKQKIE